MVSTGGCCGCDVWGHVLFPRATKKFWSRDATDVEAAACVQMAMVDSLTEVSGMSTIMTTPQRRWAYTCAAVMSAAGFMTW